MPSPIAEGPRTDHWPAVEVNGQTYPFPTVAAAELFCRAHEALGAVLKLPGLKPPAGDGDAAAQSGPDAP